MSVDLAALRALAEQATPGPWHEQGYDREERAWFVLGGGPPMSQAEGVVALTVQRNGAQNASFIAACDPQTVLALVEAVEALRIADTEASVAHDAIWSDEVSASTIGGTGIGVLHDNDRRDSAQSAIWRLHEAARSALAPFEDSR